MDAVFGLDNPIKEPEPERLLQKLSNFKEMRDSNHELTTTS